jgi:pimeloyl-ACP methyl ester carboxylesterase
MTAATDMTTVLFIHGTGVREPEFTTTFSRIEKGLTGVPGARAAPCFWGEKGARLRADGASFYFDPAARDRDRAARNRDGKARGADAVPQAELDEDEELALWERLLADPLFEIRIRRISKPPRGNPGPFLEARVRALVRDDGVAVNLGLRTELAAQELTGAFAEAVRTVTESREFRQAFGRSTTTDGNTERMLVRTLVAQCLATAAEGGTVVSGNRRDRLVEAATPAFGVADQGIEAITDPLKQWAKETAKDTVSWPFGPLLRRGRRGAIDVLADIVFYQAHGDEIREFVGGKIREIPGPVVLLAHSLGGIIAFDLLASADKGTATAGLDRVEMLVTVGSQVPLLYELFALARGVNFPALLPRTFTAKWVNVYDRRDLLAYAGRDLFSGRCHDIRIDTRTPFPAAHSAYWDTDSLYKHLAVELEKLRKEEP